MSLKKLNFGMILWILFLVFIGFIEDWLDSFLCLFVIVNETVTHISRIFGYRNGYLHYCKCNVIRNRLRNRFYKFIVTDKTYCSCIVISLYNVFASVYRAAVSRSARFRLHYLRNTDVLKLN